MFCEHISEHCKLNCMGCIHYSPSVEYIFLKLVSLKDSLEKLSKIKKYVKKHLNDA